MPHPPFYRWCASIYSDFKQRVRATKSALDARSGSHAHAASRSAGPEVLLSPNAEIAPFPSSAHATTSPQSGSTGHHQQQQGSSSSSASFRVSRQPARLLESVFVFRLEDFVVFCVSSAESKRATPRKLVSSDKKRLFLPDDMSSVHAEFSEYYFPEGMDFPVPRYIVEAI